jgi:arylsulfatase A-like enzyme
LKKEPPEFFETIVDLHLQDDEYVKSLPEDFYSSDFYTSKLISYLDERTRVERQQPFFAYLPFSAPHWPLQAPIASVEKYKGFYNDGPGALRLRRLEKLKELGLVSPDIVPHEVVLGPGEPLAWEDMTSEEKARSARSMEVYAGMLDRLDENVGRIIQYLKDSNQYDNTYILFMSDNGAEGASYEALPLIGDQVLAHIDKYYDNSLENIGRKNSFVWYGSRWAQAATAPSRLYKIFSTEGGCRVPLILKPAYGSEHEVVAGKASIVDAFCTVMDIVPTVIELAGLKHPGTRYKGREIAPLMGKSWKSFLEAQILRSSYIEKTSESSTFAIHDKNHVTGWEICGSGALRKGNYKMTYVPFPRGPQRWELYDIIMDPGETKDLSLEKADVMQELLELWEIYKKNVGVVGLAGELGNVENLLIDEFEDTGKWIRFIGKDAVPSEWVEFVPK